MATGEIVLSIEGGVSDSSSPARRRFFNSKPSLGFNTSGTGYHHFTFRMPADFASTLALIIHYKAGTNTGAVVWGCDVMAASEDELITTDSYDTANTVTDTVPATTGNLGIVSLSLTNADSVAAGDWVAIRVYRDGDNGADTLANIADIVALSLTYTTT